jgi:hypothetical protein
VPELPDRPDLDQLRRQARELLRAAISGQPDAVARLRAVSDRVMLSTAQLALAREYGFANWAALRIETRRRRRPATLDERWSFGGATAVSAAAGILAPAALRFGPGFATLDAVLTPAEDTSPAVSFAEAMETMAAYVKSQFADVTVVDDRDAKYALLATGRSVPPRADPEWVRLRLDPVPPRGCAWFELRTTAGSVSRLVPAVHRTVRAGVPMPIPGDPADEAPLPIEPTDGPSLVFDLAADLPPVDGALLRLDTVVSAQEEWFLHLRARPGWWVYSADGRTKRTVVSATAEDDLGTRYLGAFGGSANHDSYEEAAVRFQPRLDPLARSVRFTFRGTAEQVTVDLRVDRFSA